MVARAQRGRRGRGRRRPVRARGRCVTSEVCRRWVPSAATPPAMRSRRLIMRVRTLRCIALHTLRARTFSGSHTYATRIMSTVSAACRAPRPPPAHAPACSLQLTTPPPTVGGGKPAGVGGRPSRRAAPAAPCSCRNLAEPCPSLLTSQGSTVARSVGHRRRVIAPPGDCGGRGPQLSP